MAKPMSSDSLLQILRDGTPAEKNHALESVLEGRDPEIIAPILKCMEREEDRSVKERMQMVLYDLIPRNKYRDIDAMLRSPDPFVRNSAVEIIKNSDMSVIDFFKNLADDPDKDVRKFVIDSLATDISSGSRRIIRKSLRDSDINIVYTAMEYLGNMEDRQSSPVIEEILLSTGDFMVQCSALEALSKIGVSRKTTEIIERYTGRPNPVTTFPFLKYLGQFGEADSLSYITRLMRSNPDTFTKEGIDAVEGIVSREAMTELPPEVLRMLEDLVREGRVNEVNQYEIQGFLNRLSGSGSKEKARDMLQDDSEMVVLGGIELLGDCGDESDIDRLEEIAEKYEDKDEILEAVGDAVMKIDERTG